MCIHYSISREVKSGFFSIISAYFSRGFYPICTNEDYKGSPTSVQRHQKILANLRDNMGIPEKGIFMDSFYRLHYHDGNIRKKIYN